MIEAAPTMEDLWLALQLFRDPILCAVVAGAVLGYVSVFVVLRRMVFVTAALTQSAGLGVGLAFFASIHLGWSLPPSLGPVLGAIAASLLSALALSLDARRLYLSREVVLACVWMAGSAGAVLVGSRITQEAHDISAILFGSAVLVRPLDLWLVIGVGSVVLAGGVAARRSLVFAGFDPDGARVQGVPVRGLEFAFLAALTLFVSVSTRALGALPVFAFAVLPGVAGLLLSRGLGGALLVATLSGALSGGMGYLLAFIFDLPVGASQAALALVLVLVAMPIRRLRG